MDEVKVLKAIQEQLQTFVHRDVVASVGPVSVVICIEDSFYDYSYGVYNPSTCCTAHDHAPVVTGYGTDPVGGDYWLVKNSWGTTWGENGYIKIARNRDNLCNIAYYAVVSFCEKCWNFGETKFSFC